MANRQKVTHLGIELVSTPDGVTYFSHVDDPPNVNTADYVKTNQDVPGVAGGDAFSSEPMIWSMDLRKRVNERTNHFPCGHWHKKKPVVLNTPEQYQGRWIYPTVQYNTSYMYAYEVDPHNTTLSRHLFGKDYVVKVDLSTSPPTMVDRLKLGATYTGSFDPWRLKPAQQGPFCISKDGTRVFYMLRHYTYHWYSNAADTRHGELVEIDITGTYMKVIKITMINDLFDTNSCAAIDACADSLYSYWITNNKKLIKIKNGTHDVISITTFAYQPTAIDMDREWNRLFIAFDETTSYNSIERYDPDIVKESVFSYKNCNFLREVDDWLFIDTTVFSLLTKNPCYLIGKNWANFVSNYFHVSTVLDYIQQVLGAVRTSVGSDYSTTEVYILQGLNNIDASNILYCLNSIGVHTGDVGLPYAEDHHMETLGSKNINYWAGHGYGLSFDWVWSSMAVMAYNTPKIAHIRYKEDSVNTGTTDGLYKNWLACFSASPSFTELTDTAIESCGWHY